MKNVELVYFQQTKNNMNFLLPPNKRCGISLLPPNKNCGINLLPSNNKKKKYEFFFLLPPNENVELVYFHQTKIMKLSLLPPNIKCEISLLPGGGRVVRRCCVSYITGASN